MMTKEQIIDHLKSLANKENVAGMGRFGINTATAFGIKIPVLRTYAKELKRELKTTPGNSPHKLAKELWKTGYHEARLLATFIDDPKEITERQMEQWIIDFNSWDICDQACGNLFDKTPWAYAKAIEWSMRDAEFEKRAGYALMAALALHDKKAKDEKFIPFFQYIERGAGDDRNFVKKAVNWALRQIGKRNITLNHVAIQVAQKIQQQESKCARWIAADALRELQNPKILGRLKEKTNS